MTLISMATAPRVIRYCVENDEPIMLEGAPGIGKTQVFTQVAAELGLRFIDYRALLRDPVDVRGLPVPNMDSGTTTWLRPDDLPFQPYDGQPCFVLIDEIDRAGPQMQGALLGLVLERRAGTHILHPSTRIGAAGNGKTDSQGTGRMSRALTSRFSWFTVEADAKATADHFNKIGAAPVVSAFLRFRPELACDYRDKELKTPPNPRSWERVSNIVKTAPADLIDSLVAARVGQNAADEFRGFRQIWNSIDSPDYILANPTTARVPADSEIAAQWAISTALARAVTRKTFAAALTYAKRLPAEYGTVLVLDAVKRDESLKVTAEFTQWQIENQDISL